MSDKKKELKLSEAQQTAVNESGHNILVMASAGSGKTFVLIQRLMKRIIKDHISIDQIVAMTFTDAASIEMRNRLSKAIKEAIKDCEDAELKKYLELQLAKLVNAKISTIHSFCLDITKQYYYMVGITAAACNNLIDEATANEVKHQLLKEIIAKNYRKNPDLVIKLFDQVGCQNFNFDELEATITNLIQHANEMTSPVVWLETLKNPNQIAKFNKNALDDLYEYLMFDFKIFFEIYGKIAHLSGWKNPDLLIKNYETALAAFEKVNNYQDLLGFITTSSYTSLPRKDKDVDKDEFEIYSSQIKTIGEDIAGKLMPIHQIEKVDQAIGDIRTLLVEMTVALYEGFQKYKKDHEYIDFNDFEHYAYQILTANDGAIAKVYQQQYREILIDEFQDTNNIQYDIAKLISNNNLFLVGDVKQSIYRFRGARPEIMVALAKDPNFKVLHLKDNYRSKEKVINFNNHLFDLLMNINGHNFSEDDQQTVGCPDKQSNPSDNYAMCFRNIIDPDEQNNSGDYLKAVGLAEWIIELIGQKKDRNGDDSENNRMKFKDICVLVRKNSEMSLIKKVFDDYNIPCFCKDNEGYFRSYIIEVFCSYLKLLIDPNDRIALVSVLSSCLYNYSDNDLAELSIKQQLDLEHSAIGEDYQNMKALLIKNDIIGLISYFININDIYNKHLDINERSNIDLLITKLTTYKIKSPEELVKFIEESSSKQKEKAFSISKEDDVVQISTIHGSKGLQYNTVILYSKNSAQGNSGHATSVNVSERYGLGFHYFVQPYGDQYLSLNYVMNTLSDKMEELNENLRVLYVALTRAEQRLYFIDTLKKGFEDAENLSYAFFLSHSQFTPLINAAILELNPEEIQRENYILKNVSKLPKPKHSQKTETLVYTKPIKQVSDKTPSKLAHTDITLELTENIGMEIGTRMHYVMEVMDFSNATPEALKVIDPDLTDNQINKLLATLQDPIFVDAIKHDYHREYPFYYVKDGQNLHGIIDFVSFYDDHIVLIDYKTDNLENEKEFVERYHAQLEAYAKVLFESFHKPVASYIYSFNLNKTIAI